MQKSTDLCVFGLRVAHIGFLIKNRSQQGKPFDSVQNKPSFLAQGTVPDDWRQANVAPVFKKGEKYDAANYRPVLLTCICCKTLEHIIVSNINKHSFLLTVSMVFEGRGLAKPNWSSSTRKW